MKGLIAILIAGCALSFAAYGQELTGSDMSAKIRDLEKRVEALEKQVRERPSEEAQSQAEPGLISKTGWRTLRIGMNDSDVRTVLGEPTSISRISAQSYTWTYMYKTMFGIVSFDSHGVASWIEPN